MYSVLDKVNKGMIPFESRSMLVGSRRHPVKDIFDGIVSPYLYPGINRIFVPNHHKKHKHDRPDPEKYFDVNKLFEEDVESPELPVPIQVSVQCFIRHLPTRVLKMAFTPRWGMLLTPRYR